MPARSEARPDYSDLALQEWGCWMDGCARAWLQVKHYMGVLVRAQRMHGETASAHPVRNGSRDNFAVLLLGLVVQRAPLLLIGFVLTIFLESKVPPDQQED